MFIFLLHCELLDFTSVPSQTLQQVCKRVKLAFNRYRSDDKNNKRSGKPRFKSVNRFRSMVLEGSSASPSILDYPEARAILEELASGKSHFSDEDLSIGSNYLGSFCFSTGRFSLAA